MVSILFPIAYLVALVGSLSIFSKILRKRQQSKCTLTSFEPLYVPEARSVLTSLLLVANPRVLSLPSVRLVRRVSALTLDQTNPLPNHGSLNTSLAISTSHCFPSILRRLDRFSSQRYFEELWTTSSSSGRFVMPRPPSRHYYNVDRSETSCGRGSLRRRKSWKLKSSKLSEKQTRSNQVTVRGSSQWRVRWSVTKSGRKFTKTLQRDAQKRVSFTISSKYLPYAGR